MPTAPGPLSPSTRLLCGPGPANVAESVLAAMQKPLLGHVDPEMQEILLEVSDLLHTVFRRADGVALAVSATGTAGMELGLTNLVEPGERVIVGVNGYFGRRIANMARRHGAEVLEVHADWGEAVSNDELLSALDTHPDTRLLAVVHAETSTGVAHPLQQLAEAMRERPTLLMADTVTSLGGIELEAEAWGIDYCYSCSQKCLAAPPGLAPICVSPAALERIAARSAPLPFYLDLPLLIDYWITRPPVYHHTAPVLLIYALHEALRLAVEEGVEARWARHADAGLHLQDGLRALGLELLADERHQLPQLTAVRVPPGVDAVAVQRALLDEHGIEVGGGLGPTAPPIWRVGLMGQNASRAVADRLVAAFAAVLGRAGTT